MNDLEIIDLYINSSGQAIEVTQQKYGYYRNRSIIPRLPKHRRIIDANQNFYFDENGTLFIVFDEYAIAPGSEGMVTFAIPKAVISY